MKTFSTREAAKRLGIDATTLSRYIAAGKVPEPRVLQVESFRVHSWTEADIEHVRKLLPKIANGRKTRYQKLRAAQKKKGKKSPTKKKK